MKVYQILIPAVICLLALLLARTDAASDDELRRLNDRLFEITKELEARLEAKQMSDPTFLVEADDKRGMKSKWNNPLMGHTGLSLGKRTDALERQADRAKKTRTRSFFRHTALGYGKRAEYSPDLFQMNEIPDKKGGIHGFSRNTGILLGKRNVENVEE